jgi:hypothetical protein
MPVRHVECARCARPFADTRPDRRFCGSACRKAAYRDEVKVRDPELMIKKPTQVRRTFEKVETMEVLRGLWLERCRISAEEGDAFLEELIEGARAGNAKLREVLTNRLLWSPRRGDRIPRMKRYREVKTLGEIAHEYTRRVWGCSIMDAVHDRVAVPVVPRRELGCSREILPARPAAGLSSQPPDLVPLVE